MNEHRHTLVVSFACGLVLGWFAACGGETEGPTNSNSDAVETLGQDSQDSEVEVDVSLEDSAGDVIEVQPLIDVAVDISTDGVDEAPRLDQAQDAVQDGQDETTTDVDIDEPEAGEDVTDVVDAPVEPDCDETPACSPTCGRELACCDSIDNDSDGLADCYDSDCAGDLACLSERCTNGEDDDLDGFTDCEDTDCPC